MSLDPYRLPSSVHPEHYDLTLDLDIEGGRFTGSVTVSAVVTAETDVVVLNAEDLTIDSATVTADGGQPSACRIDVDANEQRLLLHPGRTLTPGPIQVALTFDGRFNDQLVGPYLSHFPGPDGETATLATTQFEATHARKCFPCWDEPAFKATFALTLVVDPGHEAIANSAEVDRTTTPDGRRAVNFAPTMKMSTYLVAFVVGPLEITDPVDVDGVEVRVVHTPGKGDLTGFALETAAFALRYFTDYFALPYPGDKIDLIGIPDFAFGAMENLGCVTFREVLVLIDPSQATQAELQRSADVINHELAHMWFGDLVTMAWWNGLWLNEAFATFMEMKCTDAFRPQWQRWVDFSLSRTAAFDTDTLASTRPIEFEVVSPDEAESMFDILTYEKGGAVVRMLEQYLGEDEFRAGIVRYMAENAYGNAETTDLWDAIEAETGQPVRRIMDSWIFQGGFPLISVATEGTTVTFTQERMVFAGGDETSETDWAVPLLFRWRAQGAEEPVSSRVLLDGEHTTVELGAEPEWLVANAGATGFVRVAYHADLLDALAEVALDELTALERYALVDDAYAAVLADRMSSMSFVTLIEAMSGEHDRSVWQRLIAGLRQMERLVDGEARERLADIAHDILAPPLANLGLAPREGDDERTRQLRGDLVRALGTVGNDPEIQEEAKRTVATARRNPELVDAALIAASVDVVASVGDEADFDDFVTAWQTATTPQEEIRYLYALADFSRADLIERLHELVANEKIRAQNAPFLLARSLSGRESGEATWRFITENWVFLNEIYATSSIPRMLAGLPTLDRADQAAETAAFFAANPLSSGGQTLRQLLEKQQINVALRDRESDRLAAFLVASNL